MTPTISELWHGNLDPVAHSGAKNKEIKEVERLLHRNIEKIEALLNDSQKELFKKYTANVNELMILYTEQSFCDGYCLGAKLTAEALIGGDEFC